MPGGRLLRGAAAGGEDDKEAQAREQYFRFKQDVEDSLAGRPVEGTRTNNGSQADTFRATPAAHRRAAAAAPDGAAGNRRQVAPPGREPALAPVDFDWSAVAWEALVRREELRRQRWIVQSRQLEMAAARNFLLPNLDLVARYRLRGFGHELTDSDPGGALGSQSAIRTCLPPSTRSGKSARSSPCPWAFARDMPRCATPNSA